MLDFQYPRQQTPEQQDHSDNAGGKGKGQKMLNYQAQPADREQNSDLLYNLQLASSKNKEFAAAFQQPRTIIPVFPLKGNI